MHWHITRLSADGESAGAVTYVNVAIASLRRQLSRGGGRDSRLFGNGVARIVVFHFTMIVPDHITGLSIWRLFARHDPSYTAAQLLRFRRHCLPIVLGHHFQVIGHGSLGALGMGGSDVLITPLRPRVRATPRAPNGHAYAHCPLL